LFFEFSKVDASLLSFSTLALSSAQHRARGGGSLSSRASPHEGLAAGEWGERREIREYQRTRLGSLQAFQRGEKK
jgi:hypothetical protein